MPFSSTSNGYTNVGAKRVLELWTIVGVRVHLAQTCAAQKAQESKRQVPTFLLKKFSRSQPKF